MEKAILDLMQLITEEKHEIAQAFSIKIIEKLKTMMDEADSDESLVRLAKMQKIVEDLQLKIKK